MALKTVVFCAAVTVAVVLGATRVETQSGFQDVAPALLTELRALRTTIASVAAAGASGQLVLGRLQIQEQRVQALIGRLDSIHTQIADVQRATDDLKERCRMLETSLKQGPQPLPNGADLSRQELEGMLKEAQASVASSVAEVERLTAVEAGLAADLATEQGRWAELSRRLEAIELLLERKD